MREIGRVLDVGRTRLPGIVETAFDLVIADHVSHFRPQDIARLATQAGLDAALMTVTWVTKELSVILKRNAIGDEPAYSKMEVAETIRHVEKQIDWLSMLVQNAKRATNSAASFGIFGSSVAATWLSGALGDHINFFVDEDPSRIGKTCMGRPIISPDQIPHGSKVFLPLIDRVATAVMGRLHRPGIEFVHPTI